MATISSTEKKKKPDKSDKSKPNKSDKSKPKLNRQDQLVHAINTQRERTARLFARYFFETGTVNTSNNSVTHSGVIEVNLEKIIFQYLLCPSWCGPLYEQLPRLVMESCLAHPETNHGFLLPSFDVGASMNIGAPSSKKIDYANDNDTIGGGLIMRSTESIQHFEEAEHKRGKFKWRVGVKLQVGGVNTTCRFNLKHPLLKAAVSKWNKAIVETNYGTIKPIVAEPKNFEYQVTDRRGIFFGGIVHCGEHAQVAHEVIGGERYGTKRKIYNVITIDKQVVRIPWSFFFHPLHPGSYSCEKLGCCRTDSRTITLREIISKPTNEIVSKVVK